MKAAVAALHPHVVLAPAAQEVAHLMMLNQQTTHLVVATSTHAPISATSPSSELYLGL